MAKTPRSSYRRLSAPAYVPFSQKERKAFDLVTATYQINTTGSFTLIFVPIPGTNFNNRIGRKTMAKSLYIRGWAALEGAVPPTGTLTASAQLCRMIVFIDNQPNAAAPAVTDLLVEALPSSQLNLDNRDRFRIIKDKQFTFDPLVTGTVVNTGPNAFNNTVQELRCYKKLAVETIYNAGNAGAIADITTGALYMFWIGSATAGAGTDSNARVSTRVRYDDS